MKKSYLCFLILLTSLIFPSLLSAQNSSSTSDIYIFLVDQSGSMRQDNLSGRVKDAVEKFIREEVKFNDRLVIIGFGDEVTYYTDDILSNTQDKERVYGQVSRIASNHQWTHMSAAFDHLAKRLDELKQLYPNSRKFTYIFTDGKNEPPDYLNENPEYFSEILNQHFGKDSYEALNSYIYYITFGTKAPEPVEQLAKESDHIKVSEQPRKEDVPVVIIPEEVEKPDQPVTEPLKIELSLLKDSFELTEGVDEQITLPFEVTSASGAGEIRLSAGDQQETATVSAETNNFEVLLNVPDVSEGTHTIELNAEVVNQEGRVIPSQFDITYRLSSLPAKVELELEEAEYEVRQTKGDEIALEFLVKSLSKPTSLKFFSDNWEEMVSISAANEDFELSVVPQADTEGPHTFVVSVAVDEEGGIVIPESFTIDYGVVIPDYTIWYIVGAVLILILALLVVYSLLPSFSGQMIFIKDGTQYPKRLKGKSGIRLVDLQKGWGIPSSMKIYPQSVYTRLKVKFSLSPKQKDEIKIAGMPVKKSPTIIKTGETIDFGHCSVKYVGSKKGK